MSAFAILVIGSDLSKTAGEQLRGPHFAFAGVVKRESPMLLNADGAPVGVLRAGQSMLEGLNALLDHREEVFIPELGATFRCPATFRIFAAQNPLQEGGGRRGLPKSFLNRFTRVHVELLDADDLHFIAGEPRQLSSSRAS